MSLTIKFAHGGEFRRLRVAAPDGGSITFMQSTVCRLFGLHDCVLTYSDDEHDTITVKEDVDLEEAIRHSHEVGNRCLKFMVSRCGAVVGRSEISGLRDQIKGLRAELVLRDTNLQAAKLKIAELKAGNDLLTKNNYELAQTERRLSMGNDDLEDELQSLRQYSADIADKNDGLESSLQTTVESVQSVKEALDRITEIGEALVPNATKRAQSYDASLAKKLEQERQDCELARALQQMTDDRCFSVTDSNGTVREFKRRSIGPTTVAAAAENSRSTKCVGSEAEEPAGAEPCVPSADMSGVLDDGILQAVSFGQSLQVFYRGKWYGGRFIKMSETDGKYVIQCDVDDEGEYTFASPDFIRLANAAALGNVNRERPSRQGFGTDV